MKGSVWTSKDQFNVGSRFFLASKYLNWGKHVHYRQLTQNMSTQYEPEWMKMMVWRERFPYDNGIFDSVIEWEKESLSVSASCVDCLCTSKIIKKKNENRMKKSLNDEHTNKTLVHRNRRRRRRDDDGIIMMREWGNKCKGQCHHHHHWHHRHHGSTRFLYI